MRLERLRQISLRRELRYALLAAMETCWAWAILEFLSILMRSPHAISPLSLFLAYWIALFAGRKLPSVKASWLRLQFTAIALAVVTLLVILRVEVYADYDWFDFTWLSRFVLSWFGADHDLPAILPAALGVGYVFVRGLGFGQRPLTLWFTGFQFRLGIVAFFVLFLAAGFWQHFDATLWILVYFSLSLLAIALARMDEMTGPVPLGPRWAVTLLAAVALVIFLGLGVLQFFTLQVADFILLAIAPVALLVEALVLVIIIPFSFVVGWLIDLLSPLFGRFAWINDILRQMIPPEAQEALQKGGESMPFLNVLGIFLKTILVLAILMGTGYLLARALNRRMKQIEEEEYIRESIGDENDHRLREARRPTRLTHAPRRNLSAESIRRIYAALIARAADAGLPRHLAETPYEFLPRLQHAFPEETDDVQTITEAYISVHYAEKPAAPEDVDRVRRVWKRVERFLKRKA